MNSNMNKNSSLEKNVVEKEKDILQQSQVIADLER